MAALSKVNNFVLDLASKVHNLGSDQLNVALTNSAPTATMTKLSDITEISYTNCSTRAITTSSAAQTSGTYKLVLTALTLTATGAVGPFRYIVLYNSTSTNSEIIGWYDFGSAVTLASGDKFTIDFDSSSGVLTLT